MRVMTIPIAFLGFSALWASWGVESKAQETTRPIAGAWVLNEDLSDELPRSLGNRPDNQRERGGGCRPRGWRVRWWPWQARWWRPGR